MTYPLAIMDYGIGGIDLLSRIKKECPDLPMLYFSDAGTVPYGRLSRMALQERVYQALDYLYGLGAQRVVVACHSASSVVKVNTDKLLSIRDISIRSALSTSVKTIGVIGGGRTVRCGYYRKALSKHGLAVTQRVAQEFSILVERGELHSDDTTATAKAILKPLRAVEAVLLACTHYPALIPVIERILPHTRIIDPIADVQAYLHTVGWLRNNEATDSLQDLFLTTGDAALMQKAAKLAFDYEIQRVDTVAI